VKLFSQNSNLYDHDTSRQTDNLPWQYRATLRAVKTLEKNKKKTFINVYYNYALNGSDVLTGCAAERSNEGREWLLAC